VNFAIWVVAYVEKASAIFVVPMAVAVAPADWLHLARAWATISMSDNVVDFV
jgi:hypothetical protein